MPEQLDLILTVSRQEAIQGLDDTAKKILQVKTTQDQLNTAKKNYKITQVEYNKQMAVEKEKMSTLSQEQKKYAKTINSQDQSMIHLAQTLAVTKRRYQELTKSERENAEIGGKMLKQIENLGKEHKDLQKSIGNTGVEVGNYKENISQALQEHTAFGAILPILKQGLQFVKVGFNSVGNAMKTIPLMILVTGFTMLFGWFTKTEKGAKALKIIVAALSGVMDSLMGVVVKGGEAIFTAFNNPKKAVEDFGKTIEDFILKRIELMMSGIKGFSTAFKLAVGGDFAGAIDAAGEAMLDLNRGMNPMVIGAELGFNALLATGKAIGDVSKDAVKSANTAIELQERENKLLLEKRAFTIEEKKLRSEIEKAKLMESNTDLTAAERIKFSNEAIAKTNELYDKKIALQREEVAIQNGRVEIGNKSTEELDKQVELQGDLFTLEEDRASLMGDMYAAQKGYEKEIREAKLKAIEEDKARIKEEESAILTALEQDLIDIETANAELLQKQIEANEKKKEQDILFAEEMDEIEYERYLESLTTEEERQIAKLDREYEFERERIKNLDISKEQETEMLLAHDQRYADARAKIKTDAAKAELSWANQTEEEKMSLAADGFNHASEIIGKETEAGKAAAVAAITMDSFVAAQKSYNSLAGLVPYGTVLGGLAAAAALAAGFGRATKLMSTPIPKRPKMEQGGWIVGASHAGGGVNYSGANVEGGEYVVNKNTMKNPAMASKIIEMNSLGNAGGSSNSIPSLSEERVIELATSVVKAIPVYVSESNISEVQRTVKAREENFKER